MPDCLRTSTKLTPRGVPSIGDLGPGGGGRALASYERSIAPILVFCCCVGFCWPARTRMSEKGRTKAVRLSERINRRRCKLVSFPKAEVSLLNVVLPRFRIHASGPCACARERFRWKFQDACAEIPASKWERPGQCA